MELDIEYKLDKDEFYHKKKKSKWKYEQDIKFKIGKYYLIICDNYDVEIVKLYHGYGGGHCLNVSGQPIKYIRYIRRIKLPREIKNLFQ